MGSGAGSLRQETPPISARTHWIGRRAPQSRPEQAGARHRHARGASLLEGRKKHIASELENFTTATENLIWERYLYLNGPLIGFGYELDGYLRVSIWNGPLPPENVSSIEAVYAMLDERAKEMGIEDIPVKFTAFISPPELVLGPQMDFSRWMSLCGATGGDHNPRDRSLFFPL